MHGATVRRPRRPHSGRAVMWLALILMVMPLLPVNTVMAGEEGESETFPVESLRFMQPIKNSLSSSSWVVAQGLDPRLASVSTERSPETGLDPQLAAGGGRSTSGGGANQQVPFRNPAPSFSRNLIITRQLGLFPMQTEPMIAVDPTDPNHLVMGTIDYNFSSSISAYVSFDAGETWDGPHPIPYFREDLTGGGDPVIVIDQDGNVYFAFISIGVEEFRIGSLVSETEVSSMAVAKSADGGITWDEPVSAARSTTSSISQVDQQGKERGIVTTGFLDKPWMAVGPNPNNPNGESLYLTYTNFDTSYSVIYADEVPFLTSPATKTTIRVVRSDDGGVTWTKPLSVSPTVLQAAGASEPGEGEGGGANIGEGATLGEGAIDPEQFLGIKTASTATTAASSGETETQAEGDETQEPEQNAVANESERTVQGSQPKVMA
ncbi:MAG TPA: sialidase family protein, partial [Thermomicrobiales bacterium]|nr:sialidase family protein [Thermomicrobiales bacterium]